MQERVYKVEVKDELYDLMEIRIQDREEIEIFVLTQALGLLELLERRVMVTAQTKNSVFSEGFQNALVRVGADPQIINLLGFAGELQEWILHPNNDVPEGARALHEKAVKLLADRVIKDMRRKREWDELYSYDRKTLNKMHEDLKLKRERELEELVRRRETLDALNR